ncbi:MAG: MEDS domain-containing protein [Terriglobales bacterium]
MSISNPPVTAPLAPSAQWHGQDSHGHVVQFYTEDAALLRTVSRFIGTALGAGDAAVVIASKAHRDGLSRQLKERGFDVTGAIRQGRLITVDAAETLSRFMREGLPDPECFASAVGGLFDQIRAAAGPSRVVAFGEMVALLWAEGKPEAAIRLEELWNDLASTCSFALHCAYPITNFNRDEDDDLFLKICAQHSAVIPDESYSALSTEGERLLSISHLQQKVQTLETARAQRADAQNSLRRKQSELANLLENAVEGVQQVGADQKIAWVNKALLRLLGYSPDEYLGHPFSEFHVDPDVFAEYWRRLMRGEDIYDCPAELRCKDGSVKQVHIYSNGLWENGEFVYTRTFVRDVTEQKRAEQALRDSEANLRLANDKLESQVEQRTAALRQLSTRVLALQDAERRRIARELHDSLGQYLVGLKLNLDMLRRAPEQAALWTQSQQLMEQCVTEIRTLSYLLHPPMIDDVGLASAARWFVEGIAERSGIQVTLDAASDMARLPAEVELVLFRILQEGLTNVHRHSGASAAEVLIRQEAGQIILEIKDNGRGIRQEALSRFDLTGAGMGVGLSGMRERVRELGGRMKVQADNHGTSLQIAMPLAPEPATTA